MAAIVDSPSAAQPTTTQPTADAQPRPATRHRFVDIDGHSVFYREAGDPSAPTVVLLHGAPSSSHMFRDLIPLLADRYHVIAPDYLGFGLSDSPTVDEFEYTFDALTDVVQALLARLGVTQYAVYVQDYGAPITWRLIQRDPQAVTALISQNGNAYEAGFVPEFWEPLWSWTAEPTPAKEQAIRDVLTLDSIRWQYLTGEPEPELVSPDAWVHDLAGLARPGNIDAQLALLKDYRGNLDLYPGVHEWLRTSGVPVLAVWGRNDPIFQASGAEAFRADSPGARIELLDGGHFLLEAHAAEVATIIHDFLG